MNRWILHAQFHINRRWTVIVLVTVVAIALSLLPAAGSRRHVEAQGLDGLALQRLVLPDQGGTAVQMLADLASQRGGWGPAPGDVVVFDPLMAHFKRASTVGVDLPPDDCESPDPSTNCNPDCGRDFQYQQNLVRFGLYTFLYLCGSGEIRRVRTP